MKLPSRETLYCYLGLSLALDLLFVAVYGGSNWLNSRHDAHIALYTDWELRIPLLPAMIVPYLSIGLLFLMPLFTLTCAQMIGLAKRMAGAILVAGIVFNLVPTAAGFARDEHPGPVASLFELLYLLDRPYNLFPSLHVALASLVVYYLMDGASRGARAAYLCWWSLLLLSVLLVHQHHLADIGGGLLLAWAIHYLLSAAGRSSSPAP